MGDDGRLEHESSTAVYHTSSDPESEPATDAVVSALTAATGTGTDDLESIDGVVDPIVFDALVRRGRRPIQIGFVYGAHEVTVDSAGEIAIRGVEADHQGGQVRRFEDQRPSQAVVRAIAEAKGIEPGSRSRSTTSSTSTRSTPCSRIRVAPSGPTGPSPFERTIYAFASAPTTASSCGR